MKRIIFASFVLACLSISCTKSDNDAPITAEAVNAPSIDYAALIVGKWQLVEVGYVYASTGNEGGCNSNYSNSSNQNIEWRDATSKEVLSFKANGDFIKDLKNDAVCKGSYKISSNFVNITSDCLHDNSQPITNINTSLLILEGTEKIQMRYEKM